MAIARDIVEGVARRLAEHAGLELPAWVVEARAAARAAAIGIDPDAYLALIASARGAAELAELIEAVRVGESRLFRHRSQIAALVDVVVPALRARGRRSIKVWSAGCAAGEEPYTLAAVLASTLRGAAIQILATDVSADALEHAARACYPASAWSDVPAEWRAAFELEGEQLRVRPEIAALVKLERANLADPAAAFPRDCDLVWCRNVLIYFTPPARRRVIDRLVAATSVGGHVFVGYSESLRGVAELDAVQCGDAVCYVRRGGEALPAPASLRAARTPAAGVPVPGRTPPSGVRELPAPPPAAARRLPRDPDQVLALRGEPSARDVTIELTARLAITNLRRLVVDLDTADLLGDELAPVLRRARAAARAAHVELVVRASRPGARRWLARHELDGEAR